jgi:hypothetical protein
MLHKILNLLSLVSRHKYSSAEDVVHAILDTPADYPSLREVNKHCIQGEHGEYHKHDIGRHRWPPEYS